MHAVILAAGQSTRTLPLTATKPKPLLRVANTSILEWNLHQLAGLADSLTIVVGYRAEQIREAVAALAPKRLKIGFVEQKQQNGPGGALRAAASELP
ncbi:MAG TPA: NTP transferase domain-containing protein, partial [archaeon]|nr:NTP transferase domain-containing protein [archaeon]